MTDVRQCACGILYTEAEWRGLRPRPWDLGDARLEIAECVCGSTISVELAEHRRDEGDDAMAEVRAERERERAEGWW